MGIFFFKGRCREYGIIDVQAVFGKTGIVAPKTVTEVIEGGNDALEALIKIIKSSQEKMNEEDIRFRTSNS